MSEGRSQMTEGKKAEDMMSQDKRDSVKSDLGPNICIICYINE